MARRTKAIELALLVFLLGAAPAAADDASLLAAYNGHQPELQVGMDQYASTVREIRPGHATEEQLRAVIDANNQMNQVLGVIAGEVQAQVPSTDDGRKAQAAALREIGLWQLANDYESRGLTEELARHFRQAARWAKRSNRVFGRYRREVRRVRAAFRAAGLKSPRLGVGY